MNDWEVPDVTGEIDVSEGGMTEEKGLSFKIETWFTIQLKAFELFAILQK
jgi:hypothetical protein